jgi:phosphonate transport system substrate-binding protein
MAKIGLWLGLLWLSLLASSQAGEQPTIPRFVMGVFLPGVSDEVNLSDIRVAMDYWMQQISHEMNVIDGHTEFFVDMSEMRESFNKKQVDMIVAPPFSIVKHFNLSDLADGFMSVRAHGQFNSLLLLVKNDTTAASLSDLRGKRLIMPDNDEMSEVFIDTKTRKQFHLGYQHFFGSVGFENKQSRLILDLFFGKADAALVYLHAYDLMMELNPQIKDKTKILLTYPLRSKSYSFFRRDYADTQNILKHINTLFENPRGREILELFKTDEISISRVKDLIPIKALYEEYAEVTK